MNRRIEGAMLSHRADADINTNPYELGLDRLVNLDSRTDVIGKAAVQRIKDTGGSRKQVGPVPDGALGCPACQKTELRAPLLFH